MRSAYSLLPALVLFAGTALSPGSARGDGDDPARAGAYCPLPEPGQVPQCLAPARAEFGDFFEAVESGDVNEAQSRRLEAALAGGASDEGSYLALSSLSYGYFRLAQAAAADPQARPELTARLDRWNQVLVEAYSDSAGNPEFQQAVKRAALDLDSKAPSAGETSALLQQISQADGQSSGLRGALEGLVGRIFGAEPSE
jgi:hypothetical protein